MGNVRYRNHIDNVNNTNLIQEGQKMNKQKLGLMIFLVGALYLFVGGWLATW
jgi:hypothetical protein